MKSKKTKLMSDFVEIISNIKKDVNSSGSLVLDAQYASRIDSILVSNKTNGIIKTKITIVRGTSSFDIIQGLSLPANGSFDLLNQPPTEIGESSTLLYIESGDSIYAESDGKTNYFNLFVSGISFLELPYSTKPPLTLDEPWVNFLSSLINKINNTPAVLVSDPINETIVDSVFVSSRTNGYVKANLFVRRSKRILGGTSMCSGAGNSSLAFDGDSSTWCAATVGFSGVYIGYDYGQTVPFIINRIGINIWSLTQTESYTLNFECSSDNSTWSLVQSIPTTSYTNNETIWIDITNPVFARYYRVKNNFGAYLNLRELYLNNVTDNTIIENISIDPGKCFDILNQSNNKYGISTGVINLTKDDELFAYSDSEKNFFGCMTSYRQKNDSQS